MNNEIRKDLAELNVPLDALSELSRLLDRTESGSDEVYLTPMGKSKGPEAILKGWDSIFNSNRDKLNDVLLELEENNRSKYGPRSIAVPWSERRDTVLNSFSADNGKEVESNIVFNGRFRPLSLTNAAKYIKLQTNAGLPYMTSKGSVLNEALNDIDNQLKENYPSVPFTRTQENNKTRLVWGYPLATVLDEMRFYRPILDYQRKVPWRAALNTADDIDAAITKLINHARSDKKYLVSIDFSNFDNSVKRKLQDYAFKVYFPSLFQKQYHPEIALHGERFNTIGLVTPDRIYRGAHGIPSGSAYTNEVGSVVQYGISNVFEENLEYSQVQGDDGAYATKDPEGLKDHFRSYGLDVNDEKSYISDNFVVYLQNLYHTDYQDDGIIRGIYPTYRALLRIVYQERFNDFSKDDIKGSDYYAIRTLSILENVKHHPLFNELVDYVVKLDKFDLEVSDQGISAYIKMREKQDGKDVRFTEYKRGDSFGIKGFASYMRARETAVK
uniref:RdRp n=1 Tax=Beihai picobirna-like virus 10 TaxID=1922515 RepID=A0A1L3KLA4_9VIRU|nr:RdRp [Beihai picobirna-like virus 10]